MLNYTFRPADRLTSDDCVRIALEHGGIVAYSDERAMEQEAYLTELTVENFGFKWIPAEEVGKYKLILIPRNDATRPLIFKGRAIHASKQLNCPLYWTMDYYNRVKGIRYSHEIEVIRSVYEVTQNPALRKVWNSFPGPVYKISIWLTGPGKMYKDISHARLVSIDKIIKEFYT